MDKCMSLATGYQLFLRSALYFHEKILGWIRRVEKRKTWKISRSAIVHQSIFRKTKATFPPQYSLADFYQAFFSFFPVRILNFFPPINEGGKYNRSCYIHGWMTTYLAHVGPQASSHFPGPFPLLPLPTTPLPYNTCTSFSFFQRAAPCTYRKVPYKRGGGGYFYSEFEKN